MKNQSRLFLSSLRMQNFATFQDEEILFDKGFNAIIGETGSGKSLILDALQLIFGMRADKKTVRKGAEFAIVEATFSDVDETVRSYLNSIGHPCNEEVVLKRIVYSTGTSKAFLNFQQCPLSTLTDFSRRFTDLVGQFENQKLLSENYQLKLLDSFAGIQSKTDSYKLMFEEMNSVQAQIQEKSNYLSELQQKRDFIEFQLNELSTLDPSEEDENLLLEKKDTLLFSQQNHETVSAAISVLSENDEFNILDGLKKITRDLEKLKGSKMTDLSARFTECHSLLQDLTFELSGTLEIEYSEAELEEIIDRLDRYQRLKRKFNTNTKGLAELSEKFHSELKDLNQSDSLLDELKKRYSILEKECLKLANDLHKERQKSSTGLSTLLSKSVQELKMNGAQLKYEVESTGVLGKLGLSRINFIAETNPGEGFFKVKEIASGGELSRILLSLRQILSANDTISVFLFDEIDTGVGGETALSIGKALRNVSSKSQVIAITHLPQIAHHADKLLVVKKESIVENEKARTISVARSIIDDEKDNFVQNMASLH